MVRRARSDTPYPGYSSLTNRLYRPTSFGTVAFARLVNAATAVFAAESLSRNRPISNPRFLPRKRMALNFRFSRPRNAIFGINVAAFKGADLARPHGRTSDSFLRFRSDILEHLHFAGKTA